MDELFETLRYDCDFLLLPWKPFWNKSIISENKKALLNEMLKCYIYLLKLKQYELPDELSK